MNDLFEGCGLIELVQSYIDDLTVNSFSWKFKERHPKAEDYFRRFEEKWNNIFHSINWIHFFDKNAIVELSSEIEARIIEVLDVLKEWLYWLLHVDIFLSAFLYGIGLEAIKNENFQKILKYYKFLRREVEKRHILIFEPFNIQPIRRYVDNEKKNKRQNLPKCSHCGSENVKKWSKFRYRCNSCGRTFSKKSNSPS